jgi:hypothetical protein
MGNARFERAAYGSGGEFVVLLSHAHFRLPSLMFSR